MVRRRGRGDHGDLGVGAARLEAVDRAVATVRRQHHKIARAVDGQVDRIQGVVADDRQLARIRPAVDALVATVGEVQRPGRVDGAAAQRIEALAQRLQLGAGGEGRGRDRRRGGRQVQHRELALAHLQPAGDVLDRVLVGVLGQAQEGRAAVLVAGPHAAFPVHRHVAEPDVARVVDLDRRRRRLARPGDAIAVIVGDQDVVGVADLQRDGVLALAGLLLGLRRQELPVGHPVEADLGADVVLDRGLVDAPGVLVSDT
jgi:hypothetical protein